MNPLHEDSGIGNTPTISEVVLRLVESCHLVMNSKLLMSRGIAISSDLRLVRVEYFFIHKFDPKILKGFIESLNRTEQIYETWNEEYLTNRYPEESAFLKGNSKYIEHIIGDVNIPGKDEYVKSVLDYKEKLLVEVRRLKAIAGHFATYRDTISAHFVKERHLGNALGILHKHKSELVPDNKAEYFKYQCEIHFGSEVGHAKVKQGYYDIAKLNEAGKKGIKSMDDQLYAAITNYLTTEGHEDTIEFLDKYKAKLPKVRN